MIQETNMIEIENEYKKIDSKWLQLQFKTAVGLVLFVFLIECIMGFALCYMGEINTTIPKFFVKYIFVPLMLNIIFLVAGYYFLHAHRLKMETKEYAVSLQLVAISVVIFSVHSVFESLYLIFTIPILLTMVYSKYELTTVVSICSICSMICAELFIKWDPDKLSLTERNYGISNFIISVFVLLSFYGVCMIVIRFERKKNAAGIQKELERYQLKWRLLIDDLTNINNRVAMANEFQYMERDDEGHTYLLAMLDIDNFKLLNDTLGHTQGDICLKEFGSILKVNCSEAKPFRFGGDEFCILFKDISLKAAIETCERIQQAFQDISVVSTAELPVSISVGIAAYLPKMTTEQLFKNTDVALYRAKMVKNSIAVFE